MSVIVIVGFPVSDIARVIQGLRDDAAFFEGVSAQAKSGGAIHHQFIAGDGELVGIDEWDSAEQFQAFFAAQPNLLGALTSIGVTGAPDVSVFGAIEGPGTF